VSDQPPKSTPPQASAHPARQGQHPADSIADIDVTFDLSDGTRLGEETPDGLTTRVDEEVITRAKRSVALGSDPPAVPPQPPPSMPPAEFDAREEPSTGRTRASCYAGRYELVGLLGVGGMGSVYRVRDLLLDEEVALKILRKDLASSPQAVRRFRREVKLTRRVAHPNVVRMFDVGERRGEHYYTMECVVGDALSTVIVPGAPLEVDRAVDLAAQIGRGVAAAHAVGVVHRDLKPDNILVTRDGRAVIADFGVAVMPGEDKVEALPTRGAGTPFYMAPEQIEGRDVNERTDLYALGLILFEMLTGTLPWRRAAEEAGGNFARLSVPAPSPKTLNPQVPDDLAALTLRLLEREQDHRPSTAAEVVRSLEAILERLRASQSPPTSVKAPASSPSSSSQWAFPAIATTNTPHVRSVAVLPLRNLGDARDNYICEAMTASLIDQLLVCPGVRVASRFALQDKTGGDLRLIGQQAGVEVVVDGTVIKLPTGSLEVLIRAIDVERGFILWSERYVRRAVEMFDMQAAIASQIAKVLTVEMSAQQRDAGPVNQDNVDLFLRARQAYAEWSPRGVRTAIELLEQALTVSPADALLRAWLALAQLRGWYLGTRQPAASSTHAADNARTALEINPAMGEAHLAQAMNAYYGASWLAALRGFEEAVRCNPALADALHALGRISCAAGRVEQGIRLLDLALRVDPKNLGAMWDSAYVLALVNQKSRATYFLERADTVCENHPNTVLARMRIGAWTGDRLMVAWAREAMTKLAFQPGTTQAPALGLFSESEPDAQVGTLMAMAASTETPPLLQGHLLQLVAERLAIGGEIEEAWSALRAASAHTIDALWFQRCPPLGRLARMPAFLSLRAHVTARAEQLFDTPGPKVANDDPSSPPAT